MARIGARAVSCGARTVLGTGRSQCEQKTPRSHGRSLRVAGPLRGSCHCRAPQRPLYGLAASFVPSRNAGHSRRAGRRRCSQGGCWHVNKLEFRPEDRHGIRRPEDTFGFGSPAPPVVRRMASTPLPACLLAPCPASPSLAPDGLIHTRSGRRPAVKQDAALHLAPEGPARARAPRGDPR